MAILFLNTCIQVLMGLVVECFTSDSGAVDSTPTAAVMCQ